MKAWQNLYTKSNVYARIYSVHDRIYVDVRSYLNSFSSHCFFIFDSTIRCTVMGGAWAHVQTWYKKVINCAQLGCHSFRSYSYIPRYTIMRNDFFVYLEIYSVYLETYEYGEVVQGVRFPDVINAGPAALAGTAAGPALAPSWPLASMLSCHPSINEILWSSCKICRMWRCKMCTVWKICWMC